MRKKSLSVFALVMINVIAVDSIKNLPMAASFGTSVLGAYLVLGLCFFLPVIMATAELAVRFPASGGVYHWIKAAMGTRAGFLSMWIMWIYNVIWYPTILSLAAATFAFVFIPENANNPYYTSGMVILLFWAATAINLRGMRASSFVSTIGAIFGTLVPMFLMIGIATWWLKNGMPTSLTFAPKDFLPIYGSLNEYAFFAAIIFSLMGMEMSSVHAEEVRNPTRDYPKALLISGIIILLSIALASFSLAIVVPAEQLDILTGVVQVFSLYSETTGLPLTQFLAVAMTLGAVGAVVTWVIGPTKGLLAAARDGYANPFLAKSKRDNTPVNILFLQAGLVSVLSLFYIYMPSIQSAYWFLSAMSAELAMIMYIMLFVSAIKLSGELRIFNGTLYRLMMLLGILSCLVVMVFGSLPPKNFELSNSVYMLSMFVGSAIFLLPALTMKRR